MFATPNEIFAACMAQKFNLVVEGSYYRPTSLEDCAVALDKIYQGHLKGRNNDKRNRPWNVVDFSTKLGADKNWLGWELEAGYNSRAELNNVIGHLWHNFMYSTIDSEGFGANPAEISFSPQESDSETPDLLRFYSYLDEAGVKFCLPATAGYDVGHYNYYRIGTHVNISTPTQREIMNVEISNRYYKLNRVIASLIGDVVRAMPRAQQFAVFGRVPFSSMVYDRGDRIEFKVFNSTRDTQAVRNYYKVAQRLADIVEETAKNVKNGNNILGVPGGADFFDYIVQDVPVEQRMAA